MTYVRIPWSAKQLHIAVSSAVKAIMFLLLHRKCKCFINLLYISNYKETGKSWLSRRKRSTYVNQMGALCNIIMYINVCPL